MKICTKCKLEKSLSCFYDEKRRKKGDGKTTVCKQCQSDYKKNKRQDKEYNQKEKDRCKSWYKNNSKKVKEFNVIYKKNNRERYLYLSAKSRAQKKGLDFNISVTDIQIPDICPLLGIRIQAGNMKNKDSSASLDRIDSSKGYVKGNIWVISNRANTIKSNASILELLCLVQNLSKYTSIQ